MFLYPKVTHFVKHCVLCKTAGKKYQPWLREELENIQTGKCVMIVQELYRWGPAVLEVNLQMTKS